MSGSHAESERTLRLSDGRRISYLDLGDSNGPAIVSCHGGLSSRLDVAPAVDAARSLGLRLLSPDRPGVGGSDYQPGRTLLDWPTDVLELVGQLEIDRFAVMGWSLGGPYAMACARVLGDRIGCLGVVAGTIPATWSGAIDEVDRLDRVLLRLSRDHPHLERSIFHVLHATAAHAPGIVAKQSGLDGAVGRDVTAAIAAGLVDADGALAEYRIFDSPWGFEPQEIATPTHVWQGTSDELVPEAWGQRLADAVPGATLHLVDGGTHFLWYDRWIEILGTLGSALPGR